MSRLKVSADMNMLKIILMLTLNALNAFVIAASVGLHFLAIRFKQQLPYYTIQ